jgi:hypothetical protein
METPSPEQVAKAFYHLFHVPMARALGVLANMNEGSSNEMGGRYAFPGVLLAFVPEILLLGIQCPPSTKPIWETAKCWDFPRPTQIHGPDCFLYRRIRGEKAVPGVRF